jgi:hypothetical protein
MIADDLSAYVYGRWDEEDEISFADGLRSAGVPLKEGIEMPKGLTIMNPEFLELRRMLEGDPGEPIPWDVNFEGILAVRREARSLPPTV